MSVVIPTTDRPSLRGAVESALAQTVPVAEVIVVADGPGELELPESDRVRVLRCIIPVGAARARQRGIEQARGEVIALLDDDDSWRPDKLAVQLRAAATCGARAWVGSSRVRAVRPDGSERVWPRRLIAPGQSVTEYLFRVPDLGAGGALLQTSTLCFPAVLGRRVRWDSPRGAVNDDPAWLIEVQRQVPDVVWLQSPEPLVTYALEPGSLSRSAVDRSAEYLAWGREHLQSESARVRGDYLCSFPVSAAVAGRSLGGVGRAVRAAVDYGRPGLPALTYAVLNGVRVPLARAADAMARSRAIRR